MQRSDKQLIVDPMEWVCWPFLPVKRRNNNMEEGNLGFLLATKEHHEGRMIIYHLYMFDQPGKEELEAAKKTEYASVDELLRDGWIVD